MIDQISVTIFWKLSKNLLLSFLNGVVFIIMIDQYAILNRKSHLYTRKNRYPIPNDYYRYRNRIDTLYWIRKNLDFVVQVKKYIFSLEFVNFTAKIPSYPLIFLQNAKPHHILNFYNTIDDQKFTSLYQKGYMKNVPILYI